MKTAQWTAVLVLALMVGGISFVSVYLGGSSSPDSGDGVVGPSEEPPSLNFPIKNFPQEGEKIVATEVGHTGHQDFWFVNDTGQDMPVGMIEKGCTCTEVEVTVAPASWRRHFIYLAAEQALQLPLRGLDNLVCLAAVHANQHPPQPDSPETTNTLMLNNRAEVPAGAIGRVRLSWRQEVVKPLSIFANLWMGPYGRASARLQAGVRIAPPVEVKKELTLPSVALRSLSLQDQCTWIECYSLTRPAFHLKVELLRDFLRPESDPVEVGEPIPMTAEQLRELEDKQETLRGMVVLSGCRIPLTVKAKAKDGTPIEWGRFHRVVQLSNPDEGIEPMQIKVTGAVLGDITVGGSGTIDLGPFLRRNGAHGDALLETDEKNFDLELDKSRVPKYLRASLSKPRENAAGHRSWVLHVEVPPGAARGDFPRTNNPAYRDSAIYVKTTEKPPRSIRVPVIGTANEG